MRPNTTYYIYIQVRLKILEYNISTSRQGFSEPFSKLEERHTNAQVLHVPHNKPLFIYARKPLGLQSWERRLI